MTAIYHPAALLRDEQKRPETFLDLKSIQAKSGSCASILNVKKVRELTFPHLFHFRFQFSGCGDYVPVHTKYSTPEYRVVMAITARTRY